VLESKKIFIDTEYYVRKGLNFNFSTLVNFKELCEEEELSNYTTSVVKQEVYQKIHDSVTNALGIIKDFKRKRHILTSIDEDFNCSIFDIIDKNDIYQKATLPFDNFLEHCNTFIVDSTNVNSEDVLKLYFNQAPPFSEKKNKEFPDAISLLSLKSYLSEGEKLYVVSDDPDMTNFCQTDTQLISIESLEKILDLYNQHEHNISQKIKEYMEHNNELIKEEIKNQFEDYEVYNNSSWEDSEVDEFTVLSIGIFEPNIIDITDELCIVVFDTDIELEITVTGPDYNNSIYDKEDRKHYVFGTTTKTEYILKTFTIEMELSYEINNSTLENIEIDNIYINGASSEIEVEIEENSPYDYK